MFQYVKNNRKDMFEGRGCLKLTDWYANKVYLLKWGNVALSQSILNHHSWMKSEAKFILKDDFCMSDLWLELSYLPYLRITDHYFDDLWSVLNTL